MSTKPLLLPADICRVSSGEVRALRDRMGLTQKELADMIGVSEYTVWRWEQSRRNISRSHTKTLRRLSDTPTAGL